MLRFCAFSCSVRILAAINIHLFFICWLKSKFKPLTSTFLVLTPCTNIESFYNLISKSFISHFSQSCYIEKFDYKLYFYMIDNHNVFVHCFQLCGILWSNMAYWLLGLWISDKKIIPLKTEQTEQMAISNGIPAVPWNRNSRIPFRTLPRKRKQLWIAFRGTKKEVISHNSFPNPLCCRENNS